MRCIRCGGKISEKTGICDFCGLKSKMENSEPIKKAVEQFEGPKYSIIFPFFASVVFSVAIVLVAFLPWGRAVYDEFSVEGTVWRLSTIIGDTRYDIPVETLMSLLVAAAGWTVGLNVIYVFRSVLGGVYKKRCRRGMLEDISLTISLVWLLVSWGLCKCSTDIWFAWWFWVEIILICINKFVFVRMYNKKHYFMRMVDKAD